ncbi:PA14 domain-containing protein [Leisingera sp. SS27]|uniref:PA14 domain-containing protein n=1 Tax=Leisingera sp. SS27 TaxID=2979462 RepID=UPI00232AD5F9|nr:PA14 domain-containing protein [Leisingera sp. SS27]MDC0658098.1 PA14 domain-containing protein [Leisingera sp. SS27]
MKILMKAAAAAMFAVLAASASAAPLKLAPANPQPSGIKPGLAVVYAYPQDVKTLAEASSALKISSEPGRPIAGLDNRDTEEGQNTLTAKRPMHVAARITGYVKLDTPGVHNIDFLTNDGLLARIGGQVVGEYDGRQSCDSTIVTQVEVPSAGWYPVDILYFQRLGTACLHMRMGPDGKRPKWMKDSAFGH